MSEAVNVCLCSEIAGSHSGDLMSMSFPWMRPFDPTLLLLVLLLLLTTIEFSLGGSSPYTSTDKTNKNKCT